MKVRKSRQEIDLSRLLARCQEIASTSPDLALEWRLPKFLSSCDELLAALPRPPDPAAPAPEAALAYRNGLELLRRLLPPDPAAEEQRLESSRRAEEQRAEGQRAPLPLPQGAASRDTVSRQIYQRAFHREQLGLREQLLGPAGVLPR
jgi:hypothetical protein